MAFCSHCGRELQPGATFCSNCGAPVTATAPTTPMAQAVPPQYPSAQPMVNYASVGDRAVAVIIDSIILFFVSLVLIIPIGLLGVALGAGFFFSPVFLVFSLIGILYFTYFEGTSGQTPGKSLVRIRVVDETSQKPVDLGRAFIRNLLRIIDELPFLYLLGLILVEVDPRKRRLGDMAATTIVVKA